MNKVAGVDEPGRWWLSLVYIAVILVAAVGAVLAPLTVFFVGSPTEGLPGIVATGGIVGGMSALVWVCLRAPAVRNRLRPGAVSISASAATFIAVGWTFLAVSGTHSYRDSDDAFWARLPFALAACVPVLVVAVCALTISRFIQRDDARRAAAARHSREVASGTGRLRG